MLHPSGGFRRSPNVASVGDELRSPPGCWPARVVRILPSHRMDVRNHVGRVTRIDLAEYLEGLATPPKRTYPPMSALPPPAVRSGGSVEAQGALRAEREEGV